MKSCRLFVLAAFMALAAQAGTSALSPIAASEVVLADLLLLKRPVVVFADSANDPAFIRQLALLGADPAALAERDVVVITDTDPAAMSDARRRLRPRGFNLVVLDKDGTTVLRKPAPRDVREITHAIDRSPLRRQEMQARNPSGRSVIQTP